MLESLVSILVVLLVIVLVIGGIVLAIVRLARRLDRRLGRLMGKTPNRSAKRSGSRSSGGRSASRRGGSNVPVQRGAAKSGKADATARASGPAGGRAAPSASTRTASARGASPSPSPSPPTFRIREAFAPKPEMRWLDEGATLRLHELAIARPRAFVASDRRPTGVALDPSEIIPSLPVDRRTPATPASDPVSYAGFDPAQRFAYLSWLASGRESLPRDPACLLVYFMGLERRGLTNGTDLGPLVQDVCRLRDLVAREQAAEKAAQQARDEVEKAGEARTATPSGDDGSTGGGYSSRGFTAFMRQSAALLWTLVALHPWSFTERDLRVLASRSNAWGEEALASLLAWFARRGRTEVRSGQPAPAEQAVAAPTLPAWAARIAAAQSPGARRSVVLDRVPEQFETLFETRFAEKHASGMALRVSKRERVVAYRPANGTLAPVECRVPDALAIASQFTPLVALYNACIDDLRPAARVQAGGEGMTLKQWSALPDDLRATLDSPFAEALGALAAAHADESGHAIVPIAEVIRAVRMENSERAKFTTAQCQMLARAVSEAGMAIEPDARLTDQGMAREAPVVLCPTPIPIEEGAEAAARYLAAAGILRLGAAVALADGDADERELEPVAAELERAFDLTEHDHRRLDALRALLRARGSDVRGLGKRALAALPGQARLGVGRLLVAVALADGTIDEKERATLATCFRALGLSVGDLEEQIAAIAPAPAGRSGAGGAPGDAADGEGDASDDAAPAAPPPLAFDREAIRAIMAETSQVAQLLADAMRGDDEPEADEDDGDGTLARRVPDDAGDVEAGTVAVTADDSASPASVPTATASAASSTAPTPHAIPGPAMVGSATRASSTPVGLSARYSAFYVALLTRESWPAPDAEALAREHRHMLSGAVEAINDWAFDAAGGPLVVEDGDRLVIDADRRRVIEAR